ncbi:MAG: GAF domain-containing protein [Prochlorothrix sp.]
MVQGIVDQVAIAIAQSILLDQMRIQNHHESTLNALTRLLYRTPNIELQSALEATVDIFNGCGGRLYVLDNSKIHLPEQHADQVQSSIFREGPKIYTTGSQPDSLDDSRDLPLEDSLIFQNYLQSLTHPAPNPKPDGAWRTTSATGTPVPASSLPTSLTSAPQVPLPLQHLRATYNLTTATSVSSPSGVWAVGDLYQEPLLRPVSMAFQGTKIRSLLVIPLVQGNELLGCLTLFRNEVDQELLWAGAQDPDKRQMAPRQSFDIWRQIKKGQAQSWESKDVSLAQRVGECFAAAVKQYHLYQRVQILNQSLVRQVEIRTMELEHSNRMVQQQQALARILAKLQKATDIASVFRSATDEVRQLLGIDRVAIYQFDDDWGGGFIREYDSVSPGWRHLILATRSDWNDSYLQESQGGRYQFHEISAVEDVYKANLSACHLEILENFYIRAFLVVPIFVSRNLWGLLGVYSHDNPRPWQESEIVFTTQIAAHLGTALQHNAQFLQTQREAERVPFMLEQQQTLAGVISKIRESLDLDQIFTTTTEEVRKLLQADRVGVFQFLPGTHWTEGEFVAENVAHGYRSALEAKVQDHCFGENHRHRYQDGAIQAVADIYDTNLSDCHRSILAEFQVRANLVVPLTLGQELWGLLCIHQCSGPRQWKTWEIEFVQQIAGQLGVALHQAQLLRESQDSQILANTANRAKSEFLANMSHELRTPLNAVLGLSEGLREGVYGELQPYQAQVLATIEKSGQHLLALINDILDVAKIEAGKIELELVPVSLQKLCNTSLNFVQQAAHQKNLKLKLSLPDSPPRIILGELRVRQILLNLLSNAVKFTPDGGKVSLIVDFKPEQEIVQFQVKDTGIGIAPENLTELFQPFVQIDSSLSRQYSGTGLGLALVKRLVEMHKGTVTVTSILGEGSCFTVVLPYQKPKHPSHLQTTPAPLSAAPPAIAEAPAPVFPPETPPAADPLNPAGDLGNLPPLAPETSTSEALTLDALVLDNPASPSPLAAQSQSYVQFPPQPSNLTDPADPSPDRPNPSPAAETPAPAQSPDLTQTFSPFDDLQPTSSLDLTPNPSLPRLNVNISCGDGTKPLVLLAEDNIANIDTFSSYLSYRGYCLIVASDGYEAVRLAQEYKPQAILMDIQMPGMDGLEAIAVIRQIPELKNVPILALTALAMAGDRERCLEAGATEYLSKPVRMQYLHHTLQTLLKANAET